MLEYNAGAGEVVLTQTWRKQLGVEVRDKLLGVCVELAHPCNNVARETDTDYLHDSLENEQGEIREIRVGAMWRALLERLEEAIAGSVRS